MTRAFVFPGQGSQSVGMGSALADAFPVAREVFQEVDDALGQKLFKLMREGPMEGLTLTANTQPALMAHSIAAMRVLEAEAGADISSAMFVAGHSLGEYSALCAARAISLADTARLLRIRGEAMQAEGLTSLFDIHELSIIGIGAIVGCTGGRGRHGGADRR